MTKPELLKLESFSETERLVFRCAVALKVAELLRRALEANGNRYHGGLAPNLTSITDVLHIPYSLLCQQVRQTPALLPDADMVALRGSMF